MDVTDVTLGASGHCQEAVQALVAPTHWHTAFFAAARGSKDNRLAIYPYIGTTYSVVLY